MCAGAGDVTDSVLLPLRSLPCLAAMFTAALTPRLCATQTNGVKFASMVLKRERGNPRFGFLLPWSPLHPIYRARATAALSPAHASELFPEAAVAGRSDAAGWPQAPEAGIPSEQLEAQPAPAEVVLASEQAAESDTAEPPPDGAANASNGTGGSAGDGTEPRERSAAQQEADLDAFSAAVAEIDEADVAPPGTEAPASLEDASACADGAAAAVTGEQPGAEAVVAPAPASVSESLTCGAATEAGQLLAATDATVVDAPKVAGLAANPPMVPGLRVRRAWDQRPEDLQPATGARRQEDVALGPLLKIVLVSRLCRSNGPSKRPQCCSAADAA